MVVSINVSFIGKLSAADMYKAGKGMMKIVTWERDDENCHLWSVSFTGYSFLRV